jgi:hypothetical protein
MKPVGLSNRFAMRTFLHEGERSNTRSCSLAFQTACSLPVASSAAKTTAWQWDD